MLKTTLTIAGGAALLLCPTAAALADCTSILVTRGASTDGSVMITYACDGEFHPILRRNPAQDHPDGAVIELHLPGGKRATIPQVPHTYAYVGLINEHQLAIGESTFGGRPELYDPEGWLTYWRLMRLALERARTAREAIDVITTLAGRYGYRSPGESISIADKHEAWILEIIGKGPGGHGAVWVAVRLPDGTIAAHANQARIATFPLDDPENCLHSPDVISFAIERGYYDPDSGRPFSFRAAYCPDTPASRRYAGARVWSIFRRAAPSLKLSPDYHRGVPGAEPYPLWIKPDRKLSVADVMALMRDHYEGTPYDLTRGPDAGPFGAPYRYRPLQWKVGDRRYTWERPISTQQTGYSFVSQSRAHLPDPIGGVLWYGVDDTYTTCYFPLYCCIDELPQAFTVGGLERFSWDSAWWVFNLAANYAQLRYDAMSADLRAAQAELEGLFLRLQPAVEQTALALHERDPELMRRYLTDYSVSRGDLVFRRWKRLCEELLTRYNDGFVQSAPGRPTEAGYPQWWLDFIAEQRGAELRLPERPADVPKSKLVD